VLATVIEDKEAMLNRWTPPRGRLKTCSVRTAGPVCNSSLELKIDLVRDEWRLARQAEGKVSGQRYADWIMATIDR
jgi:hypothetical protein